MRYPSGKHEEASRAQAPDLIVVDECHHLTDWAPGGGKAGPGSISSSIASRERLSPGGRLILLSGTPHQGHRGRFLNLPEISALAG